MDDAFSGLDVVVTGDSEFTLSGTGIYFDESLVDDIAAVDGVERVIPSIDGIGTQILDQTGSRSAACGGPPQLSGYLPEDLAGAGGIVMREGGPPPAATRWRSTPAPPRPAATPSVTRFRS